MQCFHLIIIKMKRDHGKCGAKIFCLPLMSVVSLAANASFHDTSVKTDRGQQLTR